MWAPWLLLLLASACGRTRLSDVVPDGGFVQPGQERCDGRDDDGDGQVDEHVRDAAGRYVDDAHCGACDSPCDESLPHATAVGCGLLDGTPSCVASACERGYAPSASGRCIDVGEQLCKSCVSDSDCQALPTGRCVSVGGLPHCTIDCASGCPDGYLCSADDLGGAACLPPGGDCSCDAGEDFTIACAPEGMGGCAGQQRCQDGVRSPCEVPEERCDRIDNDCDGLADEGFADERGVYSLDAAHCGACGVDCNAGLGQELTLSCGGDPFAPSCVVACADAENGVQVGDRLDADGMLDNGCECQVRALADPADDGIIDANCDGADGVISASVYVATDGDDGAPGSPTKPMRTIAAAIALSAESLQTNAPRPDIYLAAGTYTEQVGLRDGVRLHGGYRGDFLARNPGGFEVHVVAPANAAHFGAALVADGVTDGLLEGMRLTGVDAATPGAAAVGAVIRDAGPGLILRQLRIRSGRPGIGDDGQDGADGQAQQVAPGDGEPPRAALEDGAHLCLQGADNRTEGGSGGVNVCGDGSARSGGGGGRSSCPVFGDFAEQGSPGQPMNPGGGGGTAGRALRGPLSLGAACRNPPCCGLADFYVWGNNDQALPGHDGLSGGAGGAGGACRDPLGQFVADAWVAASATGGSDGGHGGGGGGGGAGGGMVFGWTQDNGCTYADGLGGAGGGGGAGGCGGRHGGAGGSGGPAVGVLIYAPNADALPTLVDNAITSENGARGGDGGAGGDGGVGAGGGRGGDLPREQRLTPTLAGPQRGERGGSGGDGGAGGSGGGGCGGASVGIWLTGLNGIDVGPISANNDFQLGRGGEGGRGGGGPVPAASGSAGTAHAVLVD